MVATTSRSIVCDLAIESCIVWVHLKFSQLSSLRVTSESVWISIKNHWDLEHRRLYLLALKPLQFRPWSSAIFMGVLQLKLLTLITDINWSCREVFWRNSSQIKATIFHLPVVYLYIFYSSDNLRSIWSSKMLCNVQGQLILESLKKTKSMSSQQTMPRKILKHPRKLRKNLKISKF